VGVLPDRHVDHNGRSWVTRGLHTCRDTPTVEGGQHPDRDAQFCYLNDQADAHLSARDPVISVDTKKKELVGPYKNGGTEWRPAGRPQKVKTHDFPYPRRGKAIPYGVYDIHGNEAGVSVGSACCVK